MLDKIFTWWNGATIGTLFTVARRGRHVGTDEFGNRYYEARDTKSYADASKVPTGWFEWMHYTTDLSPADQPVAPKAWEKPYVPNMSGTPFAWRPRGSILRSGERPRSTGDYQAWRPE